MKLTIVGDVIDNDNNNNNDYYNNCNYIEQVIKGFLEHENKSLSDLKCIILGETNIDKQVEKFTDKHNIKKIIYSENYNRYGKRARYIKNTSIINDCDCCLIFWNYQSLDTKIMINLALQSQRKIKIINININMLYKNMLDNITLSKKIFKKQNYLFEKHKKRIEKKLNKKS